MLWNAIVLRDSHDHRYVPIAQHCFSLCVILDIPRFVFRLFKPRSPPLYCHQANNILQLIMIRVILVIVSILLVNQAICAVLPKPVTRQYSSYPYYSYNHPQTRHVYARPQYVSPPSQSGYRWSPYGYTYPWFVNPQRSPTSQVSNNLVPPDGGNGGNGGVGGSCEGVACTAGNGALGGNGGNGGDAQRPGIGGIGGSGGNGGSCTGDADADGNPCTAGNGAAGGNGGNGGNQLFRTSSS